MDYYNMLMDPSGGNPIYQSSLASWGFIGMDLGLGLFGERVGNRMAKSATKAANLGYKDMVQRQYANIDRAARHVGLPTERPMYARGNKAVPEVLPETQRDWKKRQRGKVRAEYRGKRVSLKQESRKMWKSTGRALGRLGFLTAAASFVDIGLTAYIAATTPGVSRETIEQDRRAVFGNEMLDTRAAYTQRQRSMRAIHDSQMSVGRALVGQEAGYLHR